MADEKKKISLGGIDSAAEEKGSFIKTVWQFVKFLVVSGLVTIIQLVLQMFSHSSLTALQLHFLDSFRESSSRM